jgi:hypothetical protein
MIMAKFEEVTDEELPPDDYQENGYPEDPPTFETIFNAPDYASLITARQSMRAKEYTGKVNSVLKAFVTASVNAEDFPDAAALLHYGPPFSHAWGQMADENRTVARAIDMMTSPSSPLVMAVLTTTVLAAQLIRNHEDAIRQIPETRRQAKARKKAMATASKTEIPRFTVKLWKWEIPIRYRGRLKVGKIFSGFRAQTQDPESLAVKVFSDERVIKGFERQGFTIGRRDQP